MLNTVLQIHMHSDGYYSNKNNSSVIIHALWLYYLVSDRRWRSGLCWTHWSLQVNGPLLLRSLLKHIYAFCCAFCPKTKKIVLNANTTWLEHLNCKLLKLESSVGWCLGTKKKKKLEMTEIINCRFIKLDDDYFNSVTDRTFWCASVYVSESR